MNVGNHWNDLTAQQLVRYDALFELLGVLQLDDELDRIAGEVARRFKYFANVASWRLLVENGTRSFLIMDGSRGEARVSEADDLSCWDAFHYQNRRPCRIQLESFVDLPAPPEHLVGKGIREIEVIPFIRNHQCRGILSLASRHVPFTELDNRFIRIFGSFLADRVSDILLRREATAALLDRASHDALTGLPNRASILERVEGQFSLAARTGEPLSVIIADIDHFKLINDTHGHQSGDAALCEIAQCMRTVTRDGESLGRYGGEEFLFVLYPCSLEQAVLAAERIRRAVSQTKIALPDLPDGLNVTVSLGLATTFQHPDERVEQLLKRADTALYRAKREGRNRVCASD
ncbi:GGDEF domain-containing protein [Nitrincola schmidtii]|uniref:GGDEF domain-containing protein n=1 Tax=Nitrincola schmidtii TaxID=1730894 RepID=UPI00124DC00D|nr:GGDEF domain-containing protein [Nitrincola schmidtii]